jgi:hypothetical protein
MRKCLLLFLLLLPFFLMQACIGGGGNPSPTPEPLEIVKLDVPHHQQFLHGCTWITWVI